MYPASVADVVKTHAQGDHSTLQRYSPEPDATVPYYRMGVRKLEFFGGDGFYGKRISSTDLHYEHMHFVGNEGSNFGLTLGGVFSESLPDLKSYQVETPRYRKEYIDRAKTDIDNTWKERKILERFSQEYNPFYLQDNDLQLPALLCRSSPAGSKIRNQRKTACAALEYRHHRWWQQAKSLG